MLFNSLQFLYGFLPLTYGVFWLLKSKTSRYVWLTVTGYAFYAFWNYRFTALMAFSTAVSFLAGLGMLRWKDRRRRRLCLIVPIAVDLALLGFFKYATFGAANVNQLADWLNLPLLVTLPTIVLPVGISFYTFHTISYIIDSYRGTIVPTRRFFEFSCYVSLFSQLVAGPIVRFRQIEPDLESIATTKRTGALDIGWSFFAIGMIQKVLIADTIAAVINPALKQYRDLSTVSAWLAMLGYTYQLYFDFAGYSNMAVGLGYLFGIRIPQNFNSPYKALSIGDFWRRWHMSLSACLRDYLYIPLGGNRGPTWMVYRNVLITMLLGGLWHGAAWTFVFWGGYHGVLLVAYRAAGRYWDRLPALLRGVSTFVLVVVGWVFFRSEGFGMALDLLRTMFSWRPGPAMPGAAGLVAALLVAGVLAHYAPNAFELTHQWQPLAVVVLAALFLVCLAVLYVGQPSPFLYFQF